MLALGSGKDILHKRVAVQLDLEEVRGERGSVHPQGRAGRLTEAPRPGSVRRRPAPDVPLQHAHRTAAPRAGRVSLRASVSV